MDKATIELDEHIYEPAADEEEDQYSARRHKYYKSEKLLGRLYRAIDEQKIWYDEVKSKIRPHGASFWDGFLSAVKPRYEAVVSDPTEYVHRLQTARDIRGWYEDNIADARHQYSEHPIRPISELEVFIGNIINRSGVQSNRQRDNSIKLRDEFSRISSWITSTMRKSSHETLTGYASPHDNLHLCLACVHAGGEKVSGLNSSDYGNMRSFRVVAACALLSELGACEMGRRAGGGFVGVRNNGR